MVEDSNENLKYQQQLELEIEQLRDHVSVLEQELIQQQEAASQEEENDSHDGMEVKLSVENLVKAGVAEMTAQDIIQRLGEYDYKLLELNDRAKREGYFNRSQYHKERRQIMDQAPSLRDTIGDSAYDRYLFLTGQKNRVVVLSVMPGSPAQELGVQKDDIVLSYDDKMVVNWHDLRQLTSQDGYGDYVNLSLLRNEQRINILMPRGPLGIKLGMTVLDPDAEYRY